MAAQWTGTFLWLGRPPFYLYTLYQLLSFFCFFFCIIFFTTSFVSPCITQLWVSFVFLSTGRNETICGTINGLFDLQTGSSICRTNWHACWQSLPLLLERPCAMSVQRCCFINRKLQTVITIQEGKTTPILVQLKTFFLFATQVGGGGGLSLILVRNVDCPINNVDIKSPSGDSSASRLRLHSK